jgi:hypothetical protein
MYVNAYCQIGNGYSVSFKLRRMSTDGRLFLLEHVSETINYHNLTARCFNTLKGGLLESANFINGVFQKSLYRGDPSSEGSLWIQHLMTSKDKFHYLCSLKNTYNVHHCVYDGYKPITITFDCAVTNEPLTFASLQVG